MSKAKTYERRLFKALDKGYKPRLTSKERKEQRRLKARHKKGLEIAEDFARRMSDIEVPPKVLELISEFRETADHGFPAAYEPLLAVFADAVLEKFDAIAEETSKADLTYVADHIEGTKLPMNMSRQRLETICKGFYFENPWTKRVAFVPIIKGSALDKKGRLRPSIIWRQRILK